MLYPQTGGSVACRHHQRINLLASLHLLSCSEMAPPKRPLQSCPLRACACRPLTDQPQETDSQAMQLIVQSSSWTGIWVPSIPVAGLYNMQFGMYGSWISVTFAPCPALHRKQLASDEQKVLIASRSVQAACCKYVNCTHPRWPSIHRQHGKAMCITQVAHHSHCSNNEDSFSTTYEAGTCMAILSEPSVLGVPVRPGNAVCLRILQHVHES